MKAGNIDNRVAEELTHRLIEIAKASNCSTLLIESGPATIKTEALREYAERNRGSVPVTRGAVL